MPDLEMWLRTAVGEAGGDEPVLGPEAVAALLDLARDAAHNVARPAAPLAAFAAGLALGRSASQDLGALQAEVARITAAAEAWARQHGAPT